MWTSFISEDSIFSRSESLSRSLFWVYMASYCFGLEMKSRSICLNVCMCVYNLVKSIYRHIMTFVI